MRQIPEFAKGFILGSCSVAAVIWALTIWAVQ